MRHREQAADGGSRAAWCRPCSQRGSSADRPERSTATLIAGRHPRDELRQAVAEERDVVARRGAVVDEDRDVDRLGGARDAQHFAPTPSSRTTNASGPRPSTGSPSRSTALTNSVALASGLGRVGAWMRERSRGEHGRGSNERSDQCEAHVRLSGRLCRRSIGPPRTSVKDYGRPETY